MKIDKEIYSEWPSGRLLALSVLEGQTDYYDGFIGRTSRVPLGLDVKMPGECFIEFPNEILGQGDVLFSSDFFLCGYDGCRARGVLLDAHHMLIEGEGVRCSPVGEGISILQGKGRLLIGSTKQFKPNLLDVDIDEALRQRMSWLESFDVPSACSETQGRTLFAALSIMKSQGCSPQGMLTHRWSTPDRWPHRNMWLWDTTFHCIGWRHLDLEVARDFLKAVLSGQRADGFIPLSASPNGIESELTQPPILAFGVEQLLSGADDIEWLTSVYTQLTRYVRWDLDNRDADGNGLCEWKIEDSIICRSGESGMDNSSRFDSAVPLDAVDFNSFLALECETLARFAEKLGYVDEAAQWQQEYRRICRLINERLWSDELQFYCDLDPATNKHSTILSSSGFLPLLCGAATEERAEILVGHLANPEMFGTEFPVPSVSPSVLRNDAAAYSKDMWRGPTWTNLNWLISKGLVRYGYEDESRRITAKTQQEIERWCDAFGTIFEYYDDCAKLPPPALLRKGLCEPETSPYYQVFHDYGWTACLYVDSFMTTWSNNGN